MVEVKPKLFKPKNQNEYRENWKEIIHSIKEITEKLGDNKMLESFHFLSEPFPLEFEYDSKYYPTMLDVRFWVEKTKNYDSIKIDTTKGIIENDLKAKGSIVDFGFWHFPIEQRNY